MKIAHIIYSFTIGGSEAMLVDIANLQVEQAQISVIIINDLFDQELVAKFDKRIAIYLLNRKVGSRNPNSIIKLNKLIFSLKPDILHCHNHNIIQLLLPLWRSKSVLTVHSIGVLTKNFKRYKKIFAISKTVQNDILNRSGLNATLVYNGINPELVNKKTTFFKNSIFKIVIVSRLQHEKKGQHIAIEAFKIIKEKAKTEIILDLIGSGDSEQFLKNLVSQYKLTDSVNFLGMKSRENIYANLKNYDLLIQPSIEEGFGLTIAEGMAAKVPVLISDIEGPMEIIENGKYGSFFKSGNADELAEKISLIATTYLSDINLQQLNSAYEFVIKNFNIKNTVKNYFNSYAK